MVKKLAKEAFIQAWAVMLVVCVAGPLPASSFADDKAGTPLKIEDALGALLLANAAPVDLSPDGEWVAYTLKDDRKRETPSDPRFTLYTKTGAFEEALGCDIWITNTMTGESLNLTQGKGTSWTPVWSPDGKYLAFYSDRSGIAHLWLWEETNRKLREVPDAIVRPFFNSQAVRWSADSRLILFKALPENMTVEQAADLMYGPAAPAQQASEVAKKPKVTAKVYSSVPPSKERKAVTKEAPSASDPDTWMNRYLTDLAVLEVASGKITRPVRRRRPMGYWFSPDGQRFAYTHFKAVPENTQQIVYELWVVSVVRGDARVVVPEIRQMDGYFSWSPDGKQLAYVTSGPTTKADCYVVSVDGGEPRNLTSGDHPPFAPSFGEDHRPPLWDSEGKSLYVFSPPSYGRKGSNKIWKVTVSQEGFSELAAIPDRVVLNIVGEVTGGPLWSPDGRSMIVMTQHESTKDLGFYRIDLTTGAASQLLERSIHVDDELSTTDVSQRGEISFVAQDVAHTEDIWLIDPALGAPRKVTVLNPQIEGLPMGKSRTIRWRSLDGEELLGALLLPPDYQEGKRYPLIVDVYGGAHESSLVNRFGFFGAGADNMQILATRGYAVLLPDAPMGRGTPMQDLLKTVMPGVNRAVELAIADPERLGLMGHSYGGYSTLALITQTKVFRAAMASAGISNLISAYGSLVDSGFSPVVGWAETGQGGMLGSPWQYRDMYIENSPVFYLDRVETPLLIIHSEADDAVPVSQADEAFVALRRLGKEVTYVKYVGEDHWQGMWGSPNVVDYWTRVISWFDDHLKNQE